MVPTDTGLRRCTEEGRHWVHPRLGGGAWELGNHVPDQFQMAEERSCPHLNGELLDAIPAHRQLGQVREGEDVGVNVSEEVLGEVKCLQFRTVPSEAVVIRPSLGVGIQIVLTGVQNNEVLVQDREGKAAQVHARQRHPREELWVAPQGEQALENLRLPLHEAVTGVGEDALFLLAHAMSVLVVPRQHI